MKILIAYRSRLPHVGGLSLYVNQLMGELERRGYEVEVLARHPEKREYYLVKRGCSINFSDLDKIIYNKMGLYHKRLDKVGRWIKYWWEFDGYRMETAAQLMEIGSFDLIHAQCPISAKAMYRIKGAKTPLIFTCHSSFPDETCTPERGDVQETLKWKISSLIEYYGVAGSDFTIFPSKWLKETFVKRNPQVSSSKLTVIYNGLELTEFYKKMEQKCSVKVSRKSKIIICPARLVFSKGHQTLLSALAKLKQHQRDWKCWIVGEGEEYPRLMEQTKRLNLEDHVIYFGKRNDVPALLKRADLFVLPSLIDNLPYSVIEAQLAGKSVIVTDASGIPEIVADRKTGLISKAGDSEGLYENLKLLLENKALRDSLGEHAQKQAIKQWSIERMVDQTLNIYRLAIRGKKRTKAAPPIENVIPDPVTVNDLINLMDRHLMG